MHGPWPPPPMDDLFASFSVLFLILAVSGLIVLFYFVPVRLWITAVFSGLRSSELRGLRSARVRLMGFPSASPTIVPRLLADLAQQRVGVRLPRLRRPQLGRPPAARFRLAAENTRDSP